MAILADRESRLLIDGKLVTGSAGTFPTANPATEETLGVAADASAEDMGAAIGAARRAFDETDWSTNTELRVRCLRQLQQAMRDHIEDLRELTIAEVGAPRMLTSAAGACLVSTGRRGDDRLFVVVLGSAASAARYTDARNLYRWAWSQRLDVK